MGIHRPEPDAGVGAAGCDRERGRRGGGGARQTGRDAPHVLARVATEEPKQSRLARAIERYMPQPGRAVLSRRRFEDATVKSIRGNVETRMNRLFAEDETRCDAVVLAMAGLLRLELTKTRTDVDFLPLNPEVFIPAAGQGALAIECRENDEMVLDLLRAIHHEPTAVCVTAERTFLAGVEGSCRVPVGAYATMDRGQIRLKAFVANPNNDDYLETIEMGTDPITIGQRAADILLSKGGAKMLLGINS